MLRLGARGATSGRKLADAKARRERRNFKEMAVAACRRVGGQAGRTLSVVDSAREKNSIADFHWA